MRDITEAVVVVVGLMLAFMLLIGGVSSVSMAYQCSNYQEITGITTEYVFPNGCFLELDGEMVYYGEYRDRMVAEEGLKAR